MVHGDAREGKWRGNWRMAWAASTLHTTWEHGVIPLMRTPRLPVVDWTDALADLNGLVRFGERRNLVSARVPSRFKSSLLSVHDRFFFWREKYRRKNIKWTCSDVIKIGGLCDFPCKGNIDRTRQKCSEALHNTTVQQNLFLLLCHFSPAPPLLPIKRSHKWYFYWTGAVRPFSNPQAVGPRQHSSSSNSPETCPTLLTLTELSRCQNSWRRQRVTRQSSPCKQCAF